MIIDIILLQSTPSGSAGPVGLAQRIAVALLTVEDIAKHPISKLNVSFQVCATFAPPKEDEEVEHNLLSCIQPRVSIWYTDRKPVQLSNQLSESIPVVLKTFEPFKEVEIYEPIVGTYKHG